MVMRFYSPDCFGPENSVGYLAKRINQASIAGIAPLLEAEGLTYVQWTALVAIFFGFGTTNAGLARHLGHDAGATTRLLDGMEAKGWVSRTRDGADRRVVNLALTPAGSNVAIAGRTAVTQWWNDRLEGWEREDVEQLIGLLQRLHRELEPCA